MKIFACSLTLSLCLLSVATAKAQETSPSALVESLLDKHGHAYVDAREALLDRQDIVEAARATLEMTSYGPSTWLPLVLTEALAMHVTHRQEAERLQNLQGIDNNHYLRRRMPAPSAARELRQMRHVAPLMIELFLKGIETYWWSSGATAEAEEVALRRDLLIAIGRSGHPASFYFLTDVIEGGCVCCESCHIAIMALGETGAEQALPVLLNVLDEARGDVATHTAMVKALGRIHHAEVWPHIKVELDNMNPRVQEAAIRSAGVYGSRRYWTDKPVQGAKIRVAIGQSLLDALYKARDEVVVTAVLESIGSVATPEIQAMLERRLPKASFPVQSSSGDKFQRALDRLNRALVRLERHPEQVR